MQDRAMQIGQGGSIPPSSGAVTGTRSESQPARAEALRGATEVVRAAQKRVVAVQPSADPASAQPRRNLPRGSLINITV